MNMSFSLDHDAVVRDAVDSTLVALQASHATPSVKRFVLTSSVTAIATLESARRPDLTVGEKDFNCESIELAKSLYDDDPTKGAYIYAAAKTQGELAAFNFVKENNVSRDSVFSRRIQTHFAFASSAFLRLLFVSTRLLYRRDPRSRISVRFNRRMDSGCIPRQE